MIFRFSADNSSQSSSKSDSVIIKISETVVGRKLSSIERNRYINKYVFVVRKGAHFCIYLLLGFFVLCVLKEFLGVNMKIILLAIFLTFLYACSDEIHQLFVEGRSGQVTDVLLDTVGATVGCWLYFIYYKIRRKIHG